MLTLHLFEMYIVDGSFAALLVWPILRYARLQILRRRAWEQVSTAHKGHGESPQSTAADISEFAAYGGLIAAEYAWSWATIDPDVIRAAAFSSTASIHNGFQLVQYLHHHYDALGEAGKIGFTDRLVGYVGEQKATALLLAQGHSVEIAHTANQPVWDLLVDHHAANVKTITDIASIKAEALAHGHVTYIVPEDAHGHAFGNVEVLHGFDHAAADHAVHHAIAATHGETASHASGLHFPWLTVAFAVRRNWLAVQQGRDLSVALHYGIAETIGRSSGGVFGIKAGGAVGSLFGPIGALVGGVIGGVCGAKAGAALVEEYKRKPLRKAFEAFSEALNDYGSSFALKLDKIADYIEAPIICMKEALRGLETEISYRVRKPIWWIWPDFQTVLLQESAKLGNQRITEQAAANRKLLNILDRASQTRQYTDVGLIMMNAPEVSELIGDSLSLRKNVHEAQSKVFYFRKQIDPAFTLPV